MESAVTKEYLSIVKKIKSSPPKTYAPDEMLLKTVLSPCSASHDTVCDCCRELYDAFRVEYETRTLIEFREKRDDDSNPPEYILNAARLRGERAAEQFCREHQVLCPYERDEILNTVNFFVKSYPNHVDDPIFIEAVKTVLNLQMIVYRLRRDIGMSGTTVTRYDKNDNPVVEVNPLLRAQREYEQTKLQTLDFLERKLNSSDRTVHIEGSITVSELMTKIIDIDVTEKE